MQDLRGNREPATTVIRHHAHEPSLDEAALQALTPSAFEGAAATIRAWPGHAATPLVDLPRLADALGLAAIHYKDEGPRFGLGSFKALGGAYAGARAIQRALASRAESAPPLDAISAGDRAADARQITLTSATDGNHGRSVAWGARRFGARCRIYVHAEVSAARVAAIEAFGAEVRRIDGDYDASVVRCREDAAREGLLVVSDTAWPGYVEPPRDVMAGYGLMCREIAEQLAAPPTHLFVQGGVGGLAAAVIAAFRYAWGDDAPRPVIVESERAACLFESARSGAPTTVTIIEETVMAGLSCGEPSPLAWPIIDAFARDFLTLGDAAIGPAVRRLARPLDGDPAIEAGESGAAGFAALMLAAADEALRGALALGPDARVLLLGTEGPTDRAIFEALLAARN